MVCVYVCMYVCVYVRWTGGDREGKVNEEQSDTDIIHDDYVYDDDDDDDTDDGHMYLASRLPTYLDGMIEGASDNPLPLGIKMQRHDLRCMST